MRRGHPSRGFTLIETMVVIALIGILAAMAGWGMMYGTGRATYNNATYEISSIFSVAQMRARATGRPQYVLFYDDQTNAAAPNYGVALIDRQDDATGPPDFTDTAVPLDAADLPAFGLVVERIALSRPGGGLGKVRFAPLTRAVPLPAPFSAVPHTPRTAGTIPLLAACSFCLVVDNGVVGAIRFAPEGFIEPTIPGELAGGTVALLGEDGLNPRLISVAGPAGLVKVFQ